MSIGQRRRLPPTASGGSEGPVDRDTSDAAPVAFIIGPARSGTSLLYKTLCLHPDAAWISNWVARYPGTPQLAALNRLARIMPSRAQRVWFADGGNAYVYGSPRRWADRAFPMPVEGEPLYAASGVRLIGAGPDRPIGERLQRAFRTVRALGGGSVLISKRIANNGRIPFLARAFPGARFVEVVRDGRAVARSLFAVDWWLDSVVPWYGGTPREWAAEGRDPWELCARNWVEETRSIRAGLTSVAEDRVTRIHYEALVADPIPTLEAVARAIGLGPDPRWHAALEGLSFPDRNERWRRELDPAVVDRITPVLSEELQALGYLDGDGGGTGS